MVVHHPRPRAQRQPYNVTMTKKLANPKGVNMHTALPMPERFWTKVDQSGGPDACWPWMAYRGVHGYGRFRGWPTSTLAHRVSYELTTGTPIPEGMGALHTCDNPPCCNPRHLYPGTQLDNTNDRRTRKGIARGRRLYGEDHWLTKLTNQQAREIRYLADTTDFSNQRIAEMYGTSRGTVRNIRLRITWRCIDDR